MERNDLFLARQIATQSETPAHSGKQERIHKSYVRAGALTPVFLR